MKKMSEEEVLNAITDEMAREDGYPDAETYRMEHQLGKIAGEWRKKKQPALIKKYHTLFEQLLARGWNPELLTEEAALPDKHMPNLRVHDK